MDIVHDPETGKREAIEEALEHRRRRLILAASGEYENGFNAGLAAMVADLCYAGQAIVIETKVHHYHPGTTITWDGPFTRFGWPISITENIGTPGKALAIIVSLTPEG